MNRNAYLRSFVRLVDLINDFREMDFRYIL